MARPRIGLSMDTGAPDKWRPKVELCTAYTDAVARAGGLPMLLPATHDHALRLEMIAGLDGLIMSGGDDVDPKLYGQELHPKTRRMSALREAFDFAILALAEQRNLPVLGICLGCQEMNVARRGTLHQSVAEAVPDSTLTHHLPTPESYGTHVHEATIRPGTRLHGILGVERLEVNSRHRQGVAKVGHGLMPAAFASDGLVEAIEDVSMAFWVAVQWHPENLPGTLHERLFSALVKAAETNSAE